MKKTLPTLLVLLALLGSNAYASKSADDCRAELASANEFASQPRVADCILKSMGEPTPEALPDSRQWRFINLTDSAVIYVARKPATRDGEILKSWSLWSYKQRKINRNGDAYASTKQLNLYNCKSWTMANRQAVNYPDPAGTGSPVNSWSLRNDELEFEDPVPNSVGEELIETACGKHRK